MSIDYNDPSDIRIHVDMKKNKAIIVIVYNTPIFEKRLLDGIEQFLIEYDNTGYSCIEKREDGYYECNYEWQGLLNNVKVFEKKLTEEEAKEIITQVLWDKTNEEYSD